LPYETWGDSRVASIAAADTTGPETVARKNACAEATCEASMSADLVEQSTVVRLSVLTPEFVQTSKVNSSRHLYRSSIHLCCRRRAVPPRERRQWCSCILSSTPPKSRWVQSASGC